LKPLAFLGVLVLGIAVKFQLYNVPQTLFSRTLGSAKSNRFGFIAAFVKLSRVQHLGPLSVVLRLNNHTVVLFSRANIAAFCYYR